MQAAPQPQNEAARLAALRQYAILDTEPEAAYDDITKIAAYICGTPIASMTLVDRDRQWFKARIGLESGQTPRDPAFCAWAILQPEVLEVPDAREDRRFADNPFVLSAPNIRFYAGAPLVTAAGHAVGTICVIDREPRRLDPEQKSALERLARLVMTNLELRRVSAELAEAVTNIKTLSGLVPICAGCKQIRDDQGFWQQIESYVQAHTDAKFSHGLCPKCSEKYFPGIKSAKA